MIVEDMIKYIPEYWEPMDMNNEKYRFSILPPNSQEYYEVESYVSGNYYAFIENIYRLQNPYLFTKFKMRENDYGQRGEYEIKILYHDTSRENVNSIACFNFDWRYGKRFKYGPGVYFSSTPQNANKHSSRYNGQYRTMFLASVLVQNVQEVDDEVFLPGMGYDTVLCHRGSTYVKYFDNEYYPQYFVDYISFV